MRRFASAATGCVVVGVLLASGCGGGGEEATTSPSRPAAGWGPPVVLPVPAPPSYAEAVARPDGTAIAVWVDRGDGAAAQVMSAERDAHGGWSPGVPIGEASPTPIQGARVVVGGDGVATVVWALWDRPGGAVFAFVQAVREAPDGSWGEVQTLSRSTNGINEVLAAARDDGRVTVVWSGSERRDGSYHPEVRSASRSARGDWTFARVAGRTRGDGYLPRGGLVAVPGRNRTRLIWSALPRRGTPGGILTSTLDRRGRWSTPRAIAPTGSQTSELTVAAGPDGTTTAAWKAGDGRLRVARAAAAGWSNPQTVPGGAIHGQPAIAAGASGEAVVVTEQVTGGGRRSELRAQRIDRDGALGPIRTLAGRSLPASPPDGSGGSWAAAATISADGRALVAWTLGGTRPDGVPLHEEIRSRLDDGAGAWDPTETVSTFPTPIAGVVPSADGLADGGFQVRWQADRNPDVPPQASIRPG